MFFIEISDIYYSESLYSPIDGMIISHEALKAFGIACIELLPVLCINCVNVGLSSFKKCFISM